MPPSRRLDTLRKGMADSADHLRKLLREYPWIEGEKAQFGRPGSDYDWDAQDPKQVGPGAVSPWPLLAAEARFELGERGRGMQGACTSVAGRAVARSM